jgi:transcriptional regulator with XRE-family HTH domain
VDDLRIGRILRALRIRRGWTQRELGRRVGLSQQAISLIERGHSSRLSGDALRQVFAALDARWEPTVLWRGGDLDRLLDQQHANIVAEVVRRLRRSDWEVAVEATYSEWGERGSIDVIGARRPERALLIVEVKSDLTNAESTLRKADEKDRIGRGVVGPKPFGFKPLIVGRLLVLPATTSAQSRIAGLSDVLDVPFPARGATVRRWLRHPAGDLGGILFVPDTNGGGGARGPIVRERVRRRSTSVASRLSMASSTRNRP